MGRGVTVQKKQEGMKLDHLKCNLYDCHIHIYYETFLVLNLPLTPSQDKEEPPLLGELAKNHHQHEVEHDTLTQHPAEGS